jgi:hypothetical protein
MPDLPHLLDADHVLVVPDGRGLVLLGDDGARVFDTAWTELVGECGACGGEGASPDGDGLLLSFTTDGPLAGGAVARIDGAGLDWRLDGFLFPHDALRDPTDDTILVTEIARDRLTWIAGDGASAEAVKQLSPGDPEWMGGFPNGSERIDRDGSSYLLLTHRGGGLFGDAEGFLTLWEFVSPEVLDLKWRYPAEGFLHAPHGAVFREHEGELFVLYAHSDGLGDRGSSVGVATTTDLTVAPTYVADLVPEGAAAPFDFLRGVELTDDGTLWLTDSGPGSATSTLPEGRVLRVDLPAGLVATGATGGVDDLVEVPVTPTLFADGLVNPFEGWLWVPTIW